MAATLQRLARQALDFSGRASPREFWIFVAVIVFCLTPALFTEFRFFYWEVYEFERNLVRTSVFTGETNHVVERGATYSLRLVGTEATWLTVLPLALLSVPFLAICTRRMHDLGRPGWWAVIAVFCALLLGPSLAWLTHFLAYLSPPLAHSLLFLTAIPSFVVAVFALLLLMMWTASAGEENENEYGPNPTEVTT